MDHIDQVLLSRTSLAEPLERLTAALADRYRIERELGAGGMATVYLAEDLKHHRKVAIKVLKPELAAVLGAERFLREITTTAALQHPHILTLFDSGIADGFLYYVMPYVQGETLRDKLSRENQLGIDEAVRITREVAEALDYAHRHGVIHRDIKPENILLDDGHAILADFGIARAVSAAGADRLTSTGLGIGTPAYMSPEQTTGSGTLDGRSDIYALGCLLYEMLAGSPPFSGSTAQALMARHAFEPVPSLQTVRNTVPARLERVVLKALAKVPADRQDTARQLADDLATAVAPGAIAPGPAQYLNRPGLKAGLALATVLVAAMGWWLLQKAGPTAGPALPAASQSATVAVLPFVNLSPDTMDAYLAHGLGEEIAARLGQVEGLRIASRTTVARLQGPGSPDLAAEARALKLGYLVEGSVRRAGAGLRISVSLVNTVSGLRVWNSSYQPRTADLLTVQDEIADSVARAVLGRAAPSEERVIRTRSPASEAAYEQVVRGNYYLARRNPRAIAQAIDAYITATRMDSTFALGHARLASAHGTLLDWGWSYQGLSREDLLARGSAAAERALQLDSTSSEAWAAKAGVLRFRDTRSFAGVRAAYERSVSLAPRNPGVLLSYGIVLRDIGDVGLASQMLSRSLAIEPDQPIALLHLAWIEMERRRFLEAGRWLDSALMIDPGFFQAYGERALLRLVTGDTGGARADAEIVSRLRPSTDHLTGERILMALDRLTSQSAAQRRLARLRAHAPPRNTTDVHAAAAWAAVLVAAGAPDEALAFLEGVPANPPHLRIHLQEVAFDGLRSDHRFVRLIARSQVIEQPR